MPAAEGSAAAATRYRFAAAGRAYARALELAPNNAGYRERYAAFRERVAQSREFTFDKSP